MYDKCTNNTLLYIAIIILKIAILSYCGHTVIDVQDTLSWPFRKHCNSFPRYFAMF